MTGRRRSDVEARALRLVDRAQAGQIAEEDLAELKSWDADPAKTARRLAGLANSARGDRILLLLGVTDDGHAADLSTTPDVAADSLQWYEQVIAEFTSPPPYLETGPVAVPVDGSFAAAFEFATDQPPYMVRNPLRGQGGQMIDHEIPGGRPPRFGRPDTRTSSGSWRR